MAFVIKALVSLSAKSCFIKDPEKVSLLLFERAPLWPVLFMVDPCGKELSNPRSYPLVAVRYPKKSLVLEPFSISFMFAPFVLGGPAILVRLPVGIENLHPLFPIFPLSSKLFINDSFILDKDFLSNN